MRTQYAALKRRPLLPWPEASKKRLRLDWTPSALAEPSFTGARVLDVDLNDLVPYIDWTFFFAAWELKGRFPAILEHPHYGKAARELFDNARTLLDRIVSERLIQARAVYGFWPANSDSDDVVVFDPGLGIRESGLAVPTELTRFPMLRQQEQMADGTPHLSLADFVAPIDSGHADYIGAFAATAGLGAEVLARQFEQELDDYHAIMVKALADRLAEACAEWLHQRARRDWGYGLDEQFTQADLATGAIPRHSTRVRVCSLPRPQRKTAALRPPGSRTRGNCPDGELRDDACCLGERLVLRSRRAPGTSASEGSGGTRCTTMHDEKPPASPR